MMKFQPEQCPVCNEGIWLPKADDVYSFRYGRRTHQVKGQHYSICEKCGTRGYLPGQREENRKLVSAFQSRLDGYVSPSDVLAVREKYLLTQKSAALIFGGGVRSFSKWERGESFPAGPTARLIKLALKYPEVMRSLALESKVNISDEVLGIKDKSKQEIRFVYVLNETDARDTLWSPSQNDDDGSYIDFEAFDKWSNNGNANLKNHALPN